jgi:mRNA interferase RelE/StbE
VTYTIEITSTALRMLKGIPDFRVREKIRNRIDGLKKDPQKQGMPLIGNLAGYRSIRAVGQRCRIIYQVKNEKVVVLVLALGIRKESDKKDIYALAKKLLHLGLLEPPQKR